MLVLQAMATVVSRLVATFRQSKTTLAMSEKNYYFHEVREGSEVKEVHAGQGQSSLLTSAIRAALEARRAKNLFLETLSTKVV